MINGGGVEDGVEKPQQEGRWQSGSSGDTNLLPNRQPETYGKDGATFFSLERIIIVISTATFFH